MCFVLADYLKQFFILYCNSGPLANLWSDKSTIDKDIFEDSFIKLPSNGGKRSVFPFLCCESIFVCEVEIRAYLAKLFLLTNT